MKRREIDRRTFYAWLGASALTCTLGSPLVAAERGGRKSPRTKPLGPRLLGNPSAAKRLAIWGSYTCPFTAALLPILMGIVADLPERAALEWHHFPTHPPDPALHVAGLSFTGRHFWNFTAAVLKNVYDHGGAYAQLTEANILALASSEGGGAQSLQAAYADADKWQVVRDDYLAGKLLGVIRTPALFVDGYALTPDGLPMNVAAFEASLRAFVKG